MGDHKGRHGGPSTAPPPPVNGPGGSSHAWECIRKVSNSFANGQRNYNWLYSLTLCTICTHAIRCCTVGMLWTVPSKIIDPDPLSVYSGSIGNPILFIPMQAAILYTPIQLLAHWYALIGRNSSSPGIAVPTPRRLYNGQYRTLAVNDLNMSGIQRSHWRQWYIDRTEENVLLNVPEPSLLLEGRNFSRTKLHAKQISIVSSNWEDFHGESEERRIEIVNTKSFNGFCQTTITLRTSFVSTKWIRMPTFAVAISKRK